MGVDEDEDEDEDAAQRRQRAPAFRRLARPSRTTLHPSNRTRADTDYIARFTRGSGLGRRRRGIAEAIDVDPRDWRQAALGGWSDARARRIIVAHTRLYIINFSNVHFAFQNRSRARAGSQIIISRWRAFPPSHREGLPCTALCLRVWILKHEFTPQPIAHVIHLRPMMLINAFAADDDLHPVIRLHQLVKLFRSPSSA